MRNTFIASYRVHELIVSAILPFVSTSSPTKTKQLAGPRHPHRIFIIPLIRAYAHYRMDELRLRHAIAHRRVFFPVRHLAPSRFRMQLVWYILLINMYVCTLCVYGALLLFARDPCCHLLLFAVFCQSYCHLVCVQVCVCVCQLACDWCFFFFVISSLYSYAPHLDGNACRSFSALHFGEQQYILPISYRKCAYLKAVAVFFSWPAHSLHHSPSHFPMPKCNLRSV